MFKLKAISMKAAGGGVVTGAVAKGTTVAAVQAGSQGSFFLVSKSAYAFTVGLGLGAFSGVLLATSAVVIFSYLSEGGKEISTNKAYHGNL